MPDDRADALRRRELWYQLCELMGLHGEDTFPVDFLKLAITAAKAFARVRAEARRVSLTTFRAALDNPTPPTPNRYVQSTLTWNRPPKDTRQ